MQRTRRESAPKIEVPFVSEEDRCAGNHYPRKDSDWKKNPREDMEGDQNRIKERSQSIGEKGERSKQVKSSAHPAEQVSGAFEFE